MTTQHLNRAPADGRRDLRVLVVTPFEDTGWTWLSHYFEHDEIVWTFRNGDLFGRKPWWWWWFALRMAPCVKDFDVVITHAPYMTLYLAVAMRCLFVNVPHLAFSFNHGNRRFFRGVLLWLLHRVIPRIDLFVVYSQKEMDILGDIYAIPREKFCFQHWAVQPPETCGELPEDVRARQPYVACIGRSSRDCGENTGQFSEEWLQEPSAVRGLKEILLAFRNGEKLPQETRGWTAYKQRLKQSARNLVR